MWLTNNNKQILNGHNLKPDTIIIIIINTTLSLKLEDIAINLIVRHVIVDVFVRHLWNFNCNKAPIKFLFFRAITRIYYSARFINIFRNITHTDYKYESNGSAAKWRDTSGMANSWSAMLKIVLMSYWTLDLSPKTIIGYDCIIA